jgi:photosystem II stability/assembly factor-like uncharacterized protein
MKNTILSIALLSFCGMYSQNYIDGPWFDKTKYSQSRIKELTFKEEVKIINDYWETVDKDAKGSGYKLFKRWEELWKNQLDDDGKMPFPDYLWDVWSQKQLNKKNALAAPASNWKPLGPFTFINTKSWSPGQGRVNTICVDPKNSSTIYIGAPAGGIWKSANGGSTWAPLSDKIPQIGVSGIAVDYNNPNTIYISTGDKDGGDTYSVGVLKSTDGGKNWIKTGLTSNLVNNEAGDILIHPTDSNILICATGNGIYKSSDAGVTWSKKDTGSKVAFHKGSLRFKPGAPQTVYAVTNGSFFVSNDAGDTFKSVTTGLPTVGRFQLDVTPANAEYVYIFALTADNSFDGIYLSKDSGKTWIKKSDASTSNVVENKQGSYDMAIAVSSTNADEIYTGILNLWGSKDGGKTFRNINKWNNAAGASYTHADIHFLRFFDNKFYCGSDGGIYVSQDNAASFKSLTAGLQISQFYKLAVSKQSAYKIVGGLQDNGGYTFSDNTWKNYFGADGMDAAIDPSNPDKIYGFIQRGGSLYVSKDAGKTISSIGKPSDQTGNWVTPLEINSKGELFSGFNSLNILNGNAWKLQSTSDIGAGSIEVISIDPNNDNNIYISNEKSVYKSTNKGVDFVKIHDNKNIITSIAVHSSNSSIIYLTTGSSTGEALKSTDGGKTFTSFSKGLPNIGKAVIKHEGSNSKNPLYLGTASGVYYIDDSMTEWAPFDTNLPNVPVRDIEINLADKKIVIATFGRGIWESNLANSGSLSIDDSFFELNSIEVNPNPSSGIFTVKTATIGIDSIVVYDIYGKQVKVSKNIIPSYSISQIDLTEAVDGIYFIKIFAGNQAATKRLIKN